MTHPPPDQTRHGAARQVWLPADARTTARRRMAGWAGRRAATPGRLAPNPSSAAGRLLANPRFTAGRLLANPRFTAGRLLANDRSAASGRAVVWVLVVIVLAGCSVAREADQARPRPAKPPVVVPTVVVPTVVAPPQPEGLDGKSGSPAPHACAALVTELQSLPAVKLTANPNAWNDAGVPALDLCTLLLNTQPVLIGVSALPRQGDSLARLASAADLNEAAPGLGPEARQSDKGAVFVVDERVVRITSADPIDQGQLIRIGLALQNVVPKVLRNARQSDATCQESNAVAERFVHAQVQLRRDYRVSGALTCIWGTFDSTVAIVESFHADTIPEAQQTPPPQRAPVGNPGYYLPDRGLLVFRQGRRVVRVSAITNPTRAVSLESLLDIVEPLLPLFIR